MQPYKKSSFHIKRECHPPHALVCYITTEMRDNLIAVAAAVVLISAVFISLLDACDEQSSSDLFEQNSSCDLCSCINLNNILVSVEKNGSTSQYNMFVDIVSMQIFAITNFSNGDLTRDVRGKRQYSYKYIC